MTSAAKTPDEYLESLPEDRRRDISIVRNAILAALPEGYAETMQYGMIAYVVPHTIYPAGYRSDPKQALPFACLASQKNHMALYLSGIGAGPTAVQFEERYLASGKKLDKGKACVRFKKLQDLALDVVVATIASTPVDECVANYVATIPASKRKA